MKVSDLIEWLKAQNQEAIISVVVHRGRGGYYDQGGTAYVNEFDPSKHTEIEGNAILLGVYDG